MSSFNSATTEELEEELAFTDVLISSLDPDADDYEQRHQELMAQKEDLEYRLQALQGFPQDQRQSSNTSHQQQLRQRAALDRHSPSSSSSGSFETMAQPSSDGRNLAYRQASKRALPSPTRFDNQPANKRRTPDRSGNTTPAPQHHQPNGSGGPQPSIMDKMKHRQLEAERNMKRQQEDRRLAQQMSGANNNRFGSFQSSGSPATRPSVQTTLGHNGSFSRPSSQAQPPTQSPLPSMTGSHMPYPDSAKALSKVKSETSGGPARSRTPTQMPQQSHQPLPVIDLTGDSDEEVVRRPNNVSQPTDSRQKVHSKHPPPGQMQGIPPYNVPNQSHRNMPGAFPGPAPLAYPGAASSTYAGAYVPNPQQPQPHASSSRVPPNQMVAPQQSWMQQGAAAFDAGLNGIRNFGGSIGDHFSDLNHLVNGSSAQPWEVYDDDDYEEGFEDDEDAFLNQMLYGGMSKNYAGKRDLYRDRYDEIAHNDPAKTREEINALLENIRPDEDLPEHLRVQTPEALTVRLHKYQEVGLSWLQGCEDGTNKGGILADDMGLGKTIQMLSLLVTHRSNDAACKTTLILAPVALMRQWKQEIQEKVKRGHHALTVFIHHGPSKKKHFHELQHYDVVLTTFGSVATEVKRRESYLLRKKRDPDARPAASERCVLLGDESKWYRCVLDEAQCIRNRNTLTARGACMIDAKYRFCMTGTPMMNNLEELYSLLKFLRIPPYNVWEKYRLDFVSPMKGTWEEPKENAMRKLQALCKAVMLRRTKKSTFEGRPILTLPERINGQSNPTFSTDEREFYNAIESKTQLEFNRYLKRGQVGSNYSAILVILLRLRQACCHPHLIKDFGVSAAADVSPEQIMDYAKELDANVVARIKESGGNFECPVCYDATPNPAIFIPCGHNTCADCLAKIADPANAVRDGDENGRVRCPECRGIIDPHHVTDFNAFKQLHMPELLAADERAVPNGNYDDDDDSDDSDADSDDDSDDNDDDVDNRGNLKDFIVDSDEEEEEENGGDSSTEDEGDLDAVKGEVDEDEAGPSERLRKVKAEKRVKDEETESDDGNLFKSALQAKTKDGVNSDKEKKKGKGKIQGKKGKKGKGKGKAKEKKSSKSVTLAELKKLSTRNAKAKKTYLRRLRKDWISSAKIDKTLELLQEIMADPQQEKVLIFSQWTSFLDLLEVPIDENGWSYRRYDGSLSTRMREEAVDDFRDPRKNVRIMLVSLKAGNAGLNLSMASHVIIQDPFWNPYIEEQAIDRAHRLGQTRPVKVHHMRIKDTVEDRILTLQEQKRELIEQALDESASKNIARLGVRELAYLFGVNSTL